MDDFVFVCILNVTWLSLLLASKRQIYFQIFWNDGEGFPRTIANSVVNFVTYIYTVNKTTAGRKRVCNLRYIFYVVYHLKRFQRVNVATIVRKICCVTFFSRAFSVWRIFLQKCSGRYIYIYAYVPGKVPISPAITQYSSYVGPLACLQRRTEEKRRNGRLTPAGVKRIHRTRNSPPMLKRCSTTIVNETWVYSRVTYPASVAAAICACTIHLLRFPRGHHRRALYSRPVAAATAAVAARRYVRERKSSTTTAVRRDANGASFPANRRTLRRRPVILCTRACAVVRRTGADASGQTKKKRTYPPSRENRIILS